MDTLKKGDKICFTLEGERITDTVTAIHVGLTGIVYYTLNGYRISHQYLVKNE